MQKRRGVLTLALALAFAAACTDRRASSGSPAPTPDVLASALEASARDSGVPRDLLVAIARVEDGLMLPLQRSERPAAETDLPAAGPLQLRRGRLDTLKRGAELAGATEIELRANGLRALGAGALVLAELGAKTGATSDLSTWQAAIEEMSGYADAAHRERYAHEVFATLARGGRFPTSTGEVIVLPAHDLPPSLTIDLSPTLRFLAESEYEGAEWIPTSCRNKCTTTRAGNNVEFLIIHDTEGNWNASVATLQNDPNKSVQYIIGVDGRVAQFVTEDTTAWHAGNFSYNQRSIGIEHVGFADQPFPEAEYAASAKLVTHLTAKYGIPKDRAHIIGHDQVPDGTRMPQTSPPCLLSPKQCQSGSDYGGASNHDDPGIWEWPTFMERFGGKAKCNDVPDRWTCSEDKTRVFRCAPGSDLVEVQACGGCEAGDGSRYDCTKPAATTPPPVATGPTGPATTTPPPSEAPAAEESGCTASARPTPSAGSGAWITAAAALAAVAARFRRRRHQD